MKKTVYATPGTNEQFIDMREKPVCPDGMIQMQSERPETGDWIANADGEWEDNRSATEKEWAMSELAATDRCKVDDYPLNGLTREELLKRVNDYRAKLRNPARTLSAGFPDTSWRPQWPEGVKRPAV